MMIYVSKRYEAINSQGVTHQPFPVTFAATFTAAPASKSFSL